MDLLQVSCFRVGYSVRLLVKSILHCCILIGLFHCIASSLVDAFDSFGSLMWVDALRVSCLQRYTCVQGSCFFDWWDWLRCRLAYVVALLSLNSLFFS